MTDDKLDTPSGVDYALTQINSEINEFFADWWKATGELARLDKEWERRLRRALTKAAGASKELREANAAAEVEAAAEKLWPRIEELAETVEAGKARFKGLDRKAGNLQSIMAYHKAEAKYLA